MEKREFTIDKISLECITHLELQDDRDGDVRRDLARRGNIRDL